MSRSRHHVLLITHAASEKIGTVRDHVHALVTGLDADVFKIDCTLAERLDLNVFDVVILHYSLVISNRRYVSQKLAAGLKTFPGLCILFIQDEFRWVDRTAAALRDLSVDVVFSVVPPAVVRQVYRHAWCERIRFEHTLTGFVSEHLAALQVPSYEERVIDVGYRARKLPTWLGRFTEQKWRIAERFLNDAGRLGLRVDIATNEVSRLYGKRWIDFLANCRAVLGTESGASVCDFTGEIQERVERHIASHPNTTHDEIHDLYVGDADGQIIVNAISPRCFEAAALRTLMIMYPGEYNGILDPDRHYVLLQPDHSNIEDVVAVLRSPARAKEIIQTAYDEIVMSGRWTHAAFAEHVNRVIREEAAEPSAVGLDRGQMIFFSGLTWLIAVRQRIIFWAVPRVYRCVVFLRRAIEGLPPPARDRVMPVARGVWRQFRWVVRRALRGA